MLKLPPLDYIDRETGERRQETTYGEPSLAFLYSPLGRPLQWLIAKNPLVSKLYGSLQARPSSAKKVAPFIQKYGVDTSEFEQQNFTSFNDFFTRKLKPTARPIAPGPNIAVCPADGRYQVINDPSSLVVKGQQLSLAELLGDEQLADEYSSATLLLARLCPVDYHRFHFPVDGTPSTARTIHGPLSSVHPVALRQRLRILSQNKRQLTTLDSPTFGKVLIIEVGATCVGTIHQTYIPDKPVSKGDEKGYFSFGGSATILLFPKLQLDPAFLRANAQGLELYCKMGQILGFFSGSR